MTYAQYMASPAWRAVRAQRLALDGGRCVVCGGAAVNVHHLTYANFGHEDIRRDLVSVCRRCHTHFDAVEQAARRARRRGGWGRLWGWLRR